MINIHGQDAAASAESKLDTHFELNLIIKFNMSMSNVNYFRGYISVLSCYIENRCTWWKVELDTFDYRVEHMFVSIDNNEDQYL